MYLQGDEPPYLTEGTEVSAKYKGAFCEAKVRKVVHSVKCRVSTIFCVLFLLNIVIHLNLFLDKFETRWSNSCSR